MFIKKTEIFMSYNIQKYTPKITLILSVLGAAYALNINAACAQYYGGGYIYEPYEEEPYYPQRNMRRTPRSNVEILEEGPIQRIERPKFRRNEDVEDVEPRTKPIIKPQKQATPTPPAKPKSFSEFEVSKRPDISKSVIETPIFGKYMPQEVVFEFKPDASPQIIDQIIAANKLERIASWKFKLTNSIIFQYRIKDGRSVEAVMAALTQNPDILSAQPNFIYHPKQDAYTKQANPPLQYILDAMHVSEAQKLSKGTGVIMSGFDKARAEVESIAPDAKILPEPALKNQVSTSFQALRTLDRAFENKARVVNIGSANIQDKSLSRMVAAAKQQNMIIIGANGDADIIAYIPYVSGIVALMLQLKPELKTDDIRKILEQSATTVKTPDGTELKLIDALAAVKAVEGK
jgi:hypothetical protein